MAAARLRETNGDDFANGTAEKVKIQIEDRKTKGFFMWFFFIFRL